VLEEHEIGEAAVDRGSVASVGNVHTALGNERGGRVDGDGGALGKEGGTGRLREDLGDRRSVQGASVTLESRIGRGPYAPRRVLHVVLEGRSVSLPGIPPMVLRDELRF
jgi:hypothetical protein